VLKAATQGFFFAGATGFFPCSVELVACQNLHTANVFFALQFANGS
jgi:hypothetical protein